MNVTKTLYVDVKPDIDHSFVRSKSTPLNQNDNQNFEFGNDDDAVS